MPFNSWILLALVGGYYFLTECKIYKYKYQRLESQRLLFSSILAAFCFLLASFVLIGLPFSLLVHYKKFDLENSGICIREWITLTKASIPFYQPYSELTIFAFFISIITTRALNWWYSSDIPLITKAIDNQGNDIERLVASAFLSSDLLCVTLKNSKVYVGYPSVMPDPSLVTTYISLLPVISGYRDESHKLIFTTEYLNVFKQLQDEGNAADEETETTEDDLDISEVEFVVTISVSEIVTVNKFDFDVYDKFGNHTSSVQENRGTSNTSPDQSIDVTKSAPSIRKALIGLAATIYRRLFSRTG